MTGPYSLLFQISDLYIERTLETILYMKSFVPRKFRTKLPDNCTEREKQLLGNLAIDRVKQEIIILKNRSSGFKEKYESIDEKLLEKSKKKHLIPQQLQT